MSASKLLSSYNNSNALSLKEEDPFAYDYPSMATNDGPGRLIKKEWLEQFEPVKEEPSFLTQDDSLLSSKSEILFDLSDEGRLGDFTATHSSTKSGESSKLEEINFYSGVSIKKEAHDIHKYRLKGSKNISGYLNISDEPSKDSYNLLVIRDCSVVLTDCMKDQPKSRLPMNYQCRSSKIRRATCKRIISRERILNPTRAHRRREEKLECQDCGKVFRKSYMAEHLRTHTGERPYACEKCPKRFMRQAGLDKHALIHSGERPYKCNKCDKSYKANSHLQEHLKTHTGEKAFKCEQCGRGFYLKSSLTQHLRVHTGERPYQCKECGKTFTQNSNLHRHLVVHSPNAAFECKICSRKFSHRYFLILHLRGHAGERPFQCNECGKDFMYQAHLKEHSVAHSKDRSHVCYECGKGYKSASNLKAHLKIHNTEKTFECKECSKKFSQSAYLKQHLMIHTDDKHFQCIVCGKFFANNSKLKAHLRVHDRRGEGLFP